MAVIDRTSPMPLWAQLEADLRQRLSSGEFDERFPTDLELVEHYGVSRHTVREAVRHLNRTGILRRERGRGTVVNHQQFEQPLGALYSLFQSIEATGVTQHSVVLRCETVVDADVARHLELGDDEPMFFLERVRWAGEEPLAIDRAWLPLTIAAPLLDTDFSHTALYDELERLTSIRPQSGWERVAPVVPPPAERDALQMRRGEAAFFIERSSVADGRPIEWRTTVVRGERYRLVAAFHEGRPPALAVAEADHR